MECISNPKRGGGVLPAGRLDLTLIRSGILIRIHLVYNSCDIGRGSLGPPRNTQQTCVRKYIEYQE